MSILIKGMEMPTEGKISLTIFPDGRVYKHQGNLLRGYGKDCIPWKAVPVPEHGRLIDADKLGRTLDNGILKDPNCPLFVAATVSQVIDYAPTVIPADKEAPA